ncbi:MAG: DUF4384 domain-containing protein, partial [Gemmatimonadota bacterium]|nr:DUF4384 domain-containing protein [Gemmatimonadota bacterium]
MRRVAVLPLLAALSACATTSSARSVGPAGDRESVVERGPRAQIWTTDEFGTGNRIRASFRLEDDAYVIVVNVGLDGYANVIFPESPEDDGFMRGGRTYRLPGFFPGFANNFRASRYARLYNATSAYDGVYDRYAGYVFIIASWRPMHFQVAEELGLWDDYRLAAHEQRLEPYAVMHRFAERLVRGRSRDYTARFARYAAFGGGFARARSFASCLAYGSGFGHMPHWVFSTLGNWWTPVYGLGFYSLGGPHCGFGYGLRVVGFRPPGRPIATPPVRPTLPADSGDTATKPRRPRPPRPPVVGSDSGGRKSPPGRRRAEVAIEEQPIIDVTNETRDLARRRDRDADRMRRAGRGERGYQAPDGWSRTERARRSERSDVSRDMDRGEGARARHRAPVDHERARGESSRGESRGSEPRREPPPRPE